MAKYTRRGSDQLDAQIDVHLKHIAGMVAPHSIAGILIGGYGRGEGTPFILPDGTQAPFNDYDLVVVVDHVNKPVRQTFKTLESELSAKVALAVDLCPYPASHLPNCEFSLLNYEMKYGHTVVWGDEHILDAMPAYSADAIPRSEGSRLLLNRGKLLLDVKLRLAKASPLSEEERIRALKFIHKAWLAMGDAALLADQNYDISYAVKRDRIRSIGELPHRVSIVEGYVDAIECKEWGDYHDRLDGFDMAEAFQQVRTVFLDFFAWYHKRYSMRECSMPKAMLLNLKWNCWPYTVHPRRRLYEALPELLQDHPDPLVLGQMLCCSRDVESRFYKLQARFS